MRRSVARITARATPHIESRRTPGDLFLHPAPLTAAAVLFINDYLLKSAFPGVLTGKASDFAGLFVFPIVLVCIAELMLFASRHPSWQISTPGIVFSCVATGVAFALVKTMPWASDAYAVAIGALRWPVHAVIATVSGEHVPPVAPIDVVADVSDVIAVLAVIAAGFWMRMTIRPRVPPAQRPIESARV